MGKDREPEPFSHVPKALFNSELDAACGLYVKTETPDPGGRLRRRWVEAVLKAAEALLISPSVTFKVTGENAVLATLVRFFGVRAVEELMEQRAIRFVLWNGLILAPVDDDLIRRGIRALAPATGFTDTTHNDPETSCESGLQKYLADRPLHRTARRSLARLARKRTTVTLSEIPQLAADATMDAFSAGVFGEPTIENEIKNKSRLVTVANSLFEADVIARLELDIHESVETWTDLLAVANEITSSSLVLSVSESILREERVPSVPDLILSGALSLADIVTFRMRPEVRDFQEWLWTRPDPANKKQVVEAYHALINRSNSDLKISLFNQAKILGMSVLGAFAPGGFLGSTLAGVALGNADSYLTRVMHRSPRRYASFLRDLHLKNELSPTRRST